MFSGGPKENVGKKRVNGSTEVKIETISVN